MDRALDDLMAITSGCTFNIPVEDFDTNDPNQASEFGEFVNDGLGGACADSALPLAAIQNFYPIEDEIPFIVPDEVNDDMKNESEDDVIVLNQEEYCLSPESESDEEPAAAESSSTAQTGTALSYAAAAKTVAPTTEPVARVKPPYMVYQGYTSYDQIKRTRDSLERVKLFVKDGFKIMVLLRGCPGSGKSTLAKKIIEECGVENNIYQHLHSTDNFFYLNETGQYQMDVERLPEAHRWNQVNVLHVAREGLTPLVIDNTNTRAWHMVEYAKIAVCAGYEIEVMEPDTPWAFKLQELVYRNRHDVPPNALMNMLEGYEHNVSALSLLRSSNLEYAADRRPPQLGVRRLTEPNLIQVFENIRNGVHCAAERATAKVAAQAAAQAAAKKLTKAAKKQAKAEKKQAKAEKKQRKHEKRLKKMIEEARHEATESEAGDEDSNDSCVRDGDAETIEAFVATDLREKGADDDGASENSWTTIDTHDDYDDNNSSDDERESVADDDDEKDSSSYEEPTVALVRGKTRNDSATKSSGSKKGPKVRLNFQNVNSAITDLKDADDKERTSDAEGDNKPEFRSRLYDALAKSGPRLTFFKNMRTEDESSSERSKDSTMENISRKLDELDNVEGQQLSQDLETPEELLIDSNAMSASTPAAIEEEILRYVDVPTAAADQVDRSSDSKNANDSGESQPNDESTADDVPKCGWIGLENCVNLPSNVRIESSVDVLEFLPGTEKNAESVTDLGKNQDQSLKIRDVIPSCLMNEVVESGADVSLDERLMDTASTPTTKNWNSGCWLNDFESHEQVESETFPSVVGNNVSNSSASSIDHTDDLVLDVEVEKINLASNNKKELSKNILVNGEEPQSDSKEATNSQMTIQIFDMVSNEIENSSDVTLDEVLGEANPDLEVVDEIPTCSLSDAEKIIDVAPASSLTDAEKIIEAAPTSLLTDAEKASASSLADAEKAVEVAAIGPLTDAEKITEAAPAMEKKRMSLTSTIKNWLSSNPLNEVKNNASPTSSHPSKGTSFSSAIKSWVSGCSQNETKSNTDVLASPATATNTTSSAAAFDTRCKLTNSPKNLIDDSPTKLKLESKSPIRGVKNKLCNVETEICNEADILQTVLRQERQKKKRNDNAANVDDVNVASKFNRDVEGGGAVGTNVVKNIFDGAYEDVNLFGEWNQVEKNQAEHSAVDSENSDCGSNSSSSDEIRTMTDVHNSATRFVNNDINRDAGIERRKPDVNHELESRQLKNTNMTTSPPAAEIEPCWGVDSTPELNTLKERILINSFDKVFSHNNLEPDAGATASADSPADAKPTKKSSLACGFQMIENKLRPETSGKEEATSKVENVANEDETEVSFWNQWIRGESWDEKPASSAEASSVDKMESKPPRNIRDSSPSSIPKVMNSESNSCWLVNDIKSCIDLEKNHQKLPKTSNFLSGGDPFLQAKELREFVDDHRLPASAKLQNRSPNFDFLDERTDESKNLRRLSNEFSGMCKRKRGDPYTEMTASSKWDRPGDVNSFNFSDPLIGGVPNMPPSQKQLQTSPTIFAVSNSVKDRGEDESALRWKFDSLADLDTGSSNCWPKSIPKTFPTLEKEFSTDERKFESKQKTSELENFFIPPEVLHLGQNKATNTGASDVDGYDRHLVGRCREINGRGGDAYEDDLSLIEARYNSDKSTMTEGNAYTVKAKPLREDLSNMFPHEMADAILDLYEKCNGNMDWIIEILMEDGYSPSDDQLEYLSSLQNVVEYRKPAGASPIKGE